MYAVFLNSDMLSAFKSTALKLDGSAPITKETFKIFSPDDLLTIIVQTYRLLHSTHLYQKLDIHPIQESVLEIPDIDKKYMDSDLNNIFLTSEVVETNTDTDPEHLSRINGLHAIATSDGGIIYFESDDNKSTCKNNLADTTIVASAYSYTTPQFLKTELWKNYQLNY